MTSKKRALEENLSTHLSKKKKIYNAEQLNILPTINHVAEEVDFPRGGGTSFTPLEVKTIRSEAVKEAEEELFEDAKSQIKAAKKRKRSHEIQRVGNGSAAGKNNGVRIEHLNYKRMDIGMKIIGQIVSVQPLALVVSLPNQLFAHVPITNISTQLTDLLEAADELERNLEEGEDEVTGSSKPHTPDLFEIFQEGQYIRCIVTAIHAHGSNDTSIVTKSRDEVVRSSRRVELSLVPQRVNAGVQKSDLKSGFTITTAIQSIEDHGYILDLGIPDVSGFLPFKDAKLEESLEKRKYYIGQLLDVTVTKMSSNGRIFNVSADRATFVSSSLSEVTNVLSVLPGTLVQALITAVHSTGLNLQVLGFFEGTIDRVHLRQTATENLYKVGKKIKARILYGFSAAPPRFALALAEHVIALGPKRIKTEKLSPPQTMQEVYPIGRVLETVKILRLESERGVFVEVEPGLEGFVHISHISDDHLPVISSSGPWKINSIHRARILGYFPLDGFLQLSFKPSILEQKFLQVADVEIGQVVKGTIKKLTESGLFVSLSGNIDGVIWPNHYADITLKHPSKRFKVGASIKCRVLVVDSDRKRISLTAKKTLLDSTLPILSDIGDVKTGVVTHAVIFKVQEKYLMVEFYNNLKALVPFKEISDISVGKLSESFPIGRVVTVRIIAIEPENTRIVASIRQAASNFRSMVDDISAVEIGNIVEATVSEIQKDNVVLVLQPTKIRALMSMKNLANRRNLSVPQLRVNLQVGDKLDDLVVVTRNTEKGFVIVASKPRIKEALPSKNTLSMESITLGQLVGGRVTRHVRQGTLVKIAAHIGGILHPTDTSDDYETGTPFPAIDSILKAAVVAIDEGKKQLVLSTRHSKMYSGQIKPVVDREIKGFSDLQVGETIRGFIKGIADHGLFVTLGRDLDARVQIRELFDEYIKEWKERFTVNQLVKGRILSLDSETKQIEMSFRTDISKLTFPSNLSVGDLHVGQKIEGIVKKIENYGLFIQIQGSRLSGLCHKSQLSDNIDADVTIALRGFREGDRVKAVILDIEKRKISLSLKPSHFKKEDFETDQDNHSGQEPLSVIGDDPEMSRHEGVNESEPDTAGETTELEGVVGVDVNKDTHIFRPSGTAHRTDSLLAIPTLKLSGGFQWAGTQPLSAEDASSDVSSVEDDAEDRPTKKKKRKRKEIEQDLTADIHTKTPESNADFERTLLGSPNSSYLWIQYMSFQLQLSEVEKAREIARRAIRTINFREEQERLNVWIALLNLENTYGTDESLEAVFKEATRANDSKTVHLRLASILDQAEKHDKAEEQYRRTCKKFGQSSKVWTLFGEYYLRRGYLEESRNLLPRSLQSLDKRKHLKAISRFARLEYKYGESERGKTIFEGIIDSHPKRWDLWSIYMDMEVGQGDIQSLRNLFNRVLILKMTSHKAKSFFKKWLELERKLGDEDGANIVKQKAIEWTQRANASS